MVARTAQAMVRAGWLRFEPAFEDNFGNFLLTERAKWVLERAGIRVS
jgi:hypothetical protein